MKQSKRTQQVQTIIGIAVGVTLAVIGINTGQAYNTYSEGCQATGCHGNFRTSSPSPKGTVFPSSSNHTMHNGSSSMNTDCDLCHSGTSRTPVYIGSSDGIPGAVTGLGCSGCHVGAGLRKHHATRGVTGCYSGGVNCHGTGASDNPPKENVISPPYYGTAYTSVEHPANTAQVANTNENWSVGDFWGLDNDGNGLADQADYTIGPFSILSTVQVGNDISVTWQTAGGRTNTVQAASIVTGIYANLPNSAARRTNAGVFTTNYLDVGGANKGARFYRVKSTNP
jgi:hypothetical protein